MLRCIDVYGIYGIQHRTSDKIIFRPKYRVFYFYSLHEIAWHFLKHISVRQFQYVARHTYTWKNKKHFMESLRGISLDSARWDYFIYAACHTFL